MFFPRRGSLARESVDRHSDSAAESCYRFTRGQPWIGGYLARLFLSCLRLDVADRVLLFWDLRHAPSLAVTTRGSLVALASPQSSRRTAGHNKGTRPRVGGPR